MATCKSKSSFFALYKMEIDMIKESIYDEFKCIADKCPMTCCRGWAIKVENEDFDKWKNDENLKHLCTEVTKRKDEGFDMKLDSNKVCVLLDENGLCEIVKKHGDEALCKTCAEFPRKHNVILEVTDEEENDKEGEVILDEFSLSGGCPAVLDLLEKKEKAVYLPKKCREDKDFPFEYQIRNFVMNVLQDTDYSLDDKILLSLSFLHECLECEWEEDVYACIDTYNITENQKDILDNLKTKDFDKKEAFTELIQTFYDMTEYYKEEEMFRPYLTKLVDYSENVQNDLDNILKEWEKFKIRFNEENKFFSNIIAAEVFSDCISDDMGIVIENFQSIILEYIMTRLSLFIKEQLQEKVDKEILKNYVSLFIRMIGHNIEGMCEYWEENFEDTILDIDYLLLIMN